MKIRNDDIEQNKIIKIKEFGLAKKNIAYWFLVIRNKNFRNMVSFQNFSFLIKYVYTFLFNYKIIQRLDKIKINNNLRSYFTLSNVW